MAVYQQSNKELVNLEDCRTQSKTKIKKKMCSQRRLPFCCFVTFEQCTESRFMIVYIIIDCLHQTSQFSCVALQENQLYWLGNH